VCTGAGLEVGWLPLPLRQKNNPHIQTGQPGYLLAADYVERLERPWRLDRAEGDVHPGGNLHIQTDPRNIAKVADALAARRAQFDAGRAEAYRGRHPDFARRWQETLQRWEARAQPLRGWGSTLRIRTRAPRNGLRSGRPSRRWFCPSPCSTTPSPACLPPLPRANLWRVRGRQPSGR